MCMGLSSFWYCFCTYTPDGVVARLNDAMNLALRNAADRFRVQTFKEHPQLWTQNVSRTRHLVT